MKLSEFSLPCIKLPNSNYIYENRKNELSNLNESTYEIKGLLNDMKENEHRTTNFATILYIEENNYEKISMDSIKSKLKKDFSLNKYLFVNSRNNTPFESERNLIQSLTASIARNKSFVTEMIKNKKFVSLNKPKALEYLKKMYGKYTNNYNGDITSMASMDSKKSKIDYDNNSINSINNNNTRSERKRKPKNLIGNKTLRSYNSFKYEEINSVNYEDKVYSNYKYLRDNLQEIKPKNKNKRKKEKKDNNNSNFYDKTFNFNNSFENNKISTLSPKEINKTLDTLNETEKIICSYKKKLNEIKTSVQEKERKYKDYENEKLKVNTTKKELNVLYEIMSIKLGTIQSTKKHKFYGDIFEKSKKIALNYKQIFDNKIDSIQKYISHIHIIEKDIYNKHREISEKIQGINETNKGCSYLAKNEIKKDVNNLMKKVKNENKIIDNLYDNNYDDDDNNELIEEIKNKFNDIAQEINKEKEDFE